MPRHLVILAGAHKTASSHVQHTLLGSAQALNRLGIAVLGPKTMRMDLTPFSQLLRDGMTPEVVRAGAGGFLAHHAGDADTVVLMDENILGGTDRKMLMRKSRLYPWGPRRVSRLVQLFEHAQITLAIAIRNPSTFLPSCWSESLHHGRYDDFDRFVQGFDPSGPVWSGLVDRIRDVNPNVPMTLWRYEDYPAFGSSLFTHFLKPGVADVVQMDPEIRRAGLSQQAAEWFQAQTIRDKATVRAARQRFPKAGPETAYCPWSDQQSDAFRKSYDRDCEDLKNRPGVTLLRP